MTSRFNKFTFLTRTQRDFTSWSHAIVHYAQQATTPWFWLHPTDIVDVHDWAELEKFVPASPLWSPTRIHVFNAPNETWGNLLLVNTKWALSSTSEYTLEEQAVGMEVHDAPVSYIEPVTALLDFSYGADMCQAIDRSIRGHTGHIMLCVTPVELDVWPRSELWDKDKLYSIGDNVIIDATEWTRKRWEIEDLYQWPDQIVWADFDPPTWPIVHDVSSNPVDIARSLTHEKSPWVWIRNNESASETPPAVSKHSAWDPVRPLIKADTTGSWILLSTQCIPSLTDQFLDYDNVQELDTPGPRVAYDVFFVSNGETNAEANWQQLQAVCPRAQRVKNINGRRAVFQHCAALAKTSHFFIVTGKNRVTNANVFDFQPNRLKSARHWVFRAKNASNGLEYGHMSIVLYNTLHVVSTPEDFGLDYTMYSVHDEVTWKVSEAEFATSPWEAWRTAFRECVKLQDIYDRTGEPTAQERLEVWTTTAHGDNSEWVLRGANDGLQYAKENQGDRSALALTVEWSWLKDYFDNKY